MFPGANLAAWVERHAAHRPRREAVVSRRCRLTWEEFDATSRRWAAGLVERGVGPGDRVAIAAANRPEVLLLFAAASRVGAVFAPLHYRWGEREFAAAIEAAEPSYLVVDASRASVVEACGAAGDIGGVSTLASDYDGSAGGLAARASDAPPPAGGLEDVGLLIFTSGTTGEPRGVQHTWRNMLWNHRQFIDGLGLTAEDRNFSPAPLGHIAGLGVATGPLMYLGGTTILSRRFRAAKAVDLMRAEEATVSFMVPAMWRRLLDAGYEADAGSSMRVGVAGGAPVSPDLVERAAERGLHLVQGYGMTEAGPMVTLLDADDPARHARSVGRTAPHVAARVVDGAGEEVDAGEPGELVVAGPNVAEEYWREPEATERAFVDGWFRTGDLGRRRADGELELLGRRDDRFVSGGENIHPAEVESVAATHPGVGAVAVVGLDDDAWGEVAVAAVVPADDGPPTLEALRRHVSSELADFKAPRGLVVVDELPRNPTGKVRRDALVADIETGELAVRERKGG